MTLQDRITVGVAVPDVSEYAAIDEGWGIGDPRLQVEAAVARWRLEGRLPVHGRDVQLAFRSYRVDRQDEKIEAARRMVDEDGAFVVIGARDFTEGACWLAERGVPVIDVNAVPRATLTRHAPWLFTLRTAQDVLYRAFVRWAGRGGHLAGRVIGVYHDRLTREATVAAVDELDRAGHTVVTVVASDGVGMGGEHDQSAPEQFERDGVDLVLGFVGGSSWIAMLRAASTRGYVPALLDLETGEHVNDVTSRRIPADVYDATLAAAMSRVGDVAAGWSLAPETTRAVRAYESLTGHAVAAEAPVRSGEWSNLLISSDVVSLLVLALERAGQHLTRERLVAGLEGLHDVPMASGGDVSFAPDEHWGFRSLRTVRWDAARATWVAVSDFEEVQ